MLEGRYGYAGNDRSPIERAEKISGQNETGNHCSRECGWLALMTEKVNSVMDVSTLSFAILSGFVFQLSGIGAFDSWLNSNHSA